MSKRDHNRGKRDPRVVAIVERLIEARKHAGLTQSEVARMVGFAGGSSWSQHEIHRSAPSIALFLDLCDIYGISPAWALTGIQPEFDMREVARHLEIAERQIVRLKELLADVSIPADLELSA